MYINLLKNKKMVMYKIDRRGGARGGVQKSFSRTDPIIKPSFLYSTIITCKVINTVIGSVLVYDFKSLF